MTLQNIGRDSGVNLQLVPDNQVIKSFNPSAQPPNTRFAAIVRVLIAFTFLPLLAMAANAQVSAPDFSIIVLPDPQNETQYYPQVLNSQTQWIVNNQKALNIQIVLSEGDNINDGASTAQLQNLDAAFRLLDNAGIPYLLAIGNHDYNGFNPKASRDLTGFNQWFGPGRFAGKAYFKGNFPAGSNANSYGVLTINGQQYLFIGLEYRPTGASLDWAESILAANPDKEVIVVDHSFVLKNSRREDLCDDQDMPASNATGQATWMRLRKYRNITMFLSGHFTGGSGAHRSDLGDNGNLVNQLFADYQDYANGGNGWLRIMTFHPVTNSISVQTYSPYLNQYMTDATNQFTLIYHNNFPNAGKGTISGKVRNRSSCAAVAGIKVSAGSISTASAADGSYQLQVPPGKYTVTASGAGWNSNSQIESVSDSLDTQMNFYLTTGSPTPTPTPTPTPAPPPSGCTATTVGVKVCAPIAASTVSSPVRFTAAAKSTLPITAMRIYIDNVSVYQTSAASLDVSLPVSSGAHNVVVQAWDSSGAVFKLPLTVTVTLGPTPTPTPTPTPSPTPTPTPTPSGCAAAIVGVTICLPAPGSTTSSPVHVTAAAKSATVPITVMRIYVDNLSKYTVNAATIDTSLAIPAGTHTMVVQAWDAKGTVFKKSQALIVR
jgi:Carboxypeptidase regulatory-like domain/Calcineurin-like phosphoesterase